MNPAEVEVADVERHHGLEVGQFPREAISQSRESPKLHPDGEVVALHVGRADLEPIWSSGDLGFLHTHHGGWAVPTAPGILGRVALHDLRVVHVGPDP